MNRSRSVSRAAMFTSLTLVLSGVAMAKEFPGETAFEKSLMHPDPGTFDAWATGHDTAPIAPIAPISPIMQQARLATAAPAELDVESLPRHFDLLNYLSYDPTVRDQGACDSCWVWAGTGAMEISLNVALNAQGPNARRLSTQFMTSCRTAPCNLPERLQNRCWPCCGGFLRQLADWYQGEGHAIAWLANNDATGYVDTGSCEESNFTTHRPCRDVTSAGAPTYDIESIKAYRVPTELVGQERAISNIKNVLEEQKKGVVFTMWWTDGDGLRFENFWKYQRESDLWDFDPAGCGTAGGRLGGHTVLIVGYDETSTEPYWIALNSQGQGEREVFDEEGRPVRNREHGLFRIRMNMNYDCMTALPDPEVPGQTKLQPLRWFEALDVQWTNLLPGKSFPTYH